MRFLIKLKGASGRLTKALSHKMGTDVPQNNLKIIEDNATV